MANNIPGLGASERSLWHLQYLCAIVPSRFGSVTAVVLLFAGNPLEANYNIDDRVLFRLVLASVISLACFVTMRIYSQRVEEYRVNRAKKNIGLMAVSTFFLTIILLDPPEFVKDIAGTLAGFGILEAQLELITREGVPPARWGGLLINLVVAAAGCVLGFAIGSSWHSQGRVISLSSSGQES